MLKTLVSSLAVMAFVAGPVAPNAIAQATEAATVAPAHSAWSDLLGKYVQPHPDGVNRFDYAALQANSQDSAALDAYVDSFAAMDISNLPRDEQYVAWVNLYNAVTVQYVRDKYPMRSIRSGYIIGPWKKVFTVADGEKISLNDIEHEVLRKQWDEPRTHYAVNCASFGCPNLKPTAWEAATLEADLADAARDYINHPRGVTIRNDGRLRVSNIYKWFKKDFGGNEAGVIAHLREYADDDLRAKIDANPDIKNYDYDWSLNGTDF